MIQGGYYIKARKIKNGWINHAPPVVRELWDYLLREANHSNTTNNGHVVKRGQLFRRYKDIQEDLHWFVGYRKEVYHESSMKRAMKALMNEGMIELTNEPRGNLITICNYDYYTDPKNYERTDERTKSEPRANQERTKTGLSINKNEKNDKNDKNENKERGDFEKSPTLEKRKEKFYNDVARYSGKYPKQMLRSFFDHWSQVNPGGKKMHFEKQQTFQIANRLSTWYSKEKKMTNGSDLTDSINYKSINAIWE